MDKAETGTQPAAGGRAWRGWAVRLPILLLVAAAVAGAVLLRDELSFAALAAHRDSLLAYREAHAVTAALIFLGAYVAIVAFSLPGATVATLAGGFLFGTLTGAGLAVVGATVGAAAVFLAARAGFGAGVAAGIEARGGAPARLLTGLRENAWSVLLVMRLVPAVPFFLANLLPAFVGVRLFPFVVTTFFGIIPATLVFASVGSGLGEVFDKGGVPDLGVILHPSVLGPLLGLAMLAALPAVLKRYRKGA